ncbi:MAG: Chromosomal replication initiator protein DnaA [Candidatus Moranbacteria bacterium GW2011_GWF2_36_839]|nr:MAG: Chromosomal replication initiator protein DnaA [Candidatus Moranbacteria bacterium GW2011_GWF1_36_78]KKQ17235.1 MAG: Chromosomal replication initiator protein DnaA [Candidatus Moranbacteria bacterium GW2011_GWF2_36_839]HAT73753.1 chromosomal replication initiator protein DnaA [Candidatus Moranbacteria bacterium]HBY11258.1 chromosomal replication initiator protein DnaA [Candidatus Moranbacteria bacterium]
MTNEELWQTALGEIELSISKANFITWFKNTSILSLKDGHVVIGVPNGFAKEWLENKYDLYILRALKNIQGDIKSVSCLISSGPTQSFPQTNKEITVDAVQAPKRAHVFYEKKPQISQESNLNPKYTFENFVIGGSNELARAACYAVSKSLGNVYNPLFIYGGVGLGKTHLIQSIGNEALKTNPQTRVKYISSERFTSDLIDSIKNQKIQEFKEYYQKIDLLIIDDIQFISGKEKTQEEFFHIFNYLYQLNKQIVLSSDRAPKAIQILEERLRSRFEGGMIADVSKPDLETRLAILKIKAAQNGVEITEEALEFIATNIKNNIRELEGALNRVSVSAQLTKKSLDSAYTKQILSDIISSGKKKGINHKHIIKAVSDFYEISPVDLVAKNRKQEVVKPRQIAMFLMRTELSFSYPGIGDKLGGRDHTTAMHAYEKISKEIKLDEKLNEEITHLKDFLYAIN